MTITLIYPKGDFSNVLSEVDDGNNLRPLKDYSAKSQLSSIFSTAPLPSLLGTSSCKNIKKQVSVPQRGHSYLIRTVGRTWQALSFFQSIHKTCYSHLAVSWAYHFQEQLCKIRPNKIKMKLPELTRKLKQQGLSPQ